MLNFRKYPGGRCHLVWHFTPPQLKPSSYHHHANATIQGITPIHFLRLLGMLLNNAHLPKY